MISDPGEATATVFMTRKQRYTLPSKPAQGNYMSIIAMLLHPFSVEVLISNPKTAATPLKSSSITLSAH
jgi:hypothetical protein